MNNKSKEVIKRALTNISQSEVDDAIDENVSFRKETGLKNKIIRISSGHCCKWCDDLAGEYDADDAPEDIYRRHDNCTCTVIFKSEKGYENAHTKKIISREVYLKKSYKLGDISDNSKDIIVDKKIIGLEKELAKSNYADDVTDEYRRNSFSIKGVVKVPDGINIKDSKVVNEYNVATILRDLNGGIVELLKESNKNKVETPDYLWYGKLWELKSVEKGTINAIDTAIRKALSQIRNNAGGIVVDITNNEMNIVKMIETIDKRYKRSGNNYKIDIILVKDNKLFKAFKYK